MTPSIEHTAFGSITIAGKVRKYDVLIRLDGQVKKRKKKFYGPIVRGAHSGNDRAAR